MPLWKPNRRRRRGTLLTQGAGLPSLGPPLAGFIAQLSPAGVPLPGLGANGPWTFIVAHGLAIQVDGKLILTGYVSNGGGAEAPSDIAAMFRFTANGSGLDATFASGAGYVYQFNSYNDQPYGGYGPVKVNGSGQIITGLRARTCGIQNIVTLVSDPLSSGATAMTVSPDCLLTSLAPSYTLPALYPATPSYYMVSDGGDAGNGAMEVVKVASYGAGNTAWTMPSGRGQLGTSASSHTAVGNLGAIPICIYLLNAYSVDAYTSAGALDPTFNTALTTGQTGRASFPLIEGSGNGFDGTIVGMVADLTLDSSGNIVAVGWTQADCINSTQDAYFGIIRYTPAGAIDTTFGVGGAGFGTASGGGGTATSLAGTAGNQVSTATSVITCANGDYLVGGNVAVAPNTYNPPPNSGVGGAQPYIQPQAQTTNTQWALARYTSAGALRSTFGSSGIVLVGNNSTTGYATVGSFFFGVSSAASQFSLANAAGSFGAMTGKAMAEEATSPNRIYVTGYVSANGTTGTWTVMRFSATGAADNTWGTSGVVTTTVGVNNLSFSAMLALDSAGRCLVGGSVQIVSGAAPIYGIAVCRYHASTTGGTDNGSLDASFGTGGILTWYPPVGLNGVAQVCILNSMQLEAAGNIVVACTVAYTTALGFQTAVVLARFSPTGVLDTTFGQGAIATPAAPTNVVAAVSGSGILLQWTWTPTIGDVTYNVYYGATSGSETLLAAGVLTNTYLQTATAVGGYYQVAAVNSSGVAGPKSAEVQSITPSSALLTGLLAYYAMNSLSLDSSGNGNTLTVVSGIQGVKSQATGIVNKCAVYYPRNYQYAPHPTALNGAAKVSGAVWVEVDLTTATGGLICVADSAGTEWTFAFAYRNDTGKFRVNIPTGITDTTTYGETALSPVQGTRYLVGWTFDGTQTGNAARLVICVNGVQDTNVNFSGTIPAALPIGGTSQLTLGVFADNLLPLTGTMSDISLVVGTAWTLAKHAQIWNSSFGLPWPYYNPVVLPFAPTNVTAAAATPNINLTWTAVNNATTYNVYRGTTPGGESPTPLATGVATASYTDTTPVAGNIYFYKIAAVNGVGTGPQSAEVSVGYQVTLLQDNFAGTNGASITSRPMNIGGSWTDAANDFTLNGGGCVPTSTSVCLAIGNATQANMHVKATVNGSTSAFPGVAARAQDANNYWLSVFLSTSSIALYEILAGVATERASGTSSWSASTNVTIELSANGNVLQTYVNGSAISGCTYTSTDLNTVTGAGMRNNSNVSITYSSFITVTP
jgi:uncharacterized delta-60 repeat protein